MTRFNSLLIVAAIFSVTSLFADKDGRTIDFFTKDNTAWSDAAGVSSKKYGLVYATPESPGEMWFEGAPGEKQSFKWCSKGIPVGDCEQLVIEYKAMPGACFTVDTFWDTMPKEQLRPIRYALGDGEWRQVAIPVRGKIITTVMAIAGNIAGQGEEKSGGFIKVYIKSLRAARRSAVKVNSAWLNAPLIVPEPKECRFSGKTIALVKDGKADFGVCLNSNDLPLKKIIAAEIAEACGVDEKNIKVGASALELTGCDTVIDLRLKENTAKVPDKKEAYAIEFIRRGWLAGLFGARNAIILAANDKAGLYWAWQTLRQLMDKKEGSVSLAAGNISDWPDKPFRGNVTYDLRAVKMLAAMKFNAMNYPWWVMKSAWANGDTKYEPVIREMCAYAIVRGIDIAQEVGPFFEKDSITVSDDDQIERLFKIYEVSLKLGSRVAILAIDDGGRRKESFTEADKKAYDNDVLLSHAWFFKKMSDRIFREYPDTLIMAITRDYESANGVAGYYDRIGVSPKVAIMWTGEQGVTFDYPKNVIEKYEKGIEGRRYVMHDNTPGQCFGMYRRLQICEKYGEGYGNLNVREKYLGTRDYGVGVSTQIGMVKCFQIAEHLWNASRYDAEKARQRAIAKVAGSPEAVEPIIRFSEEYLKIALKYPVDKRLSEKKLNTSVVGFSRLEDKELPRYNIDDEEYSKLKRNTAEIGDLLKRIEQTCRNPEMTAEFNAFYQNMNEIIDYLHKNNKPLPLVKPEEGFVFDINAVPGGTHYRDWGNGKIGAAIYGQQTPNHTLEAAFQMESVPATNAVLVIEGQDCDKNIATIRVELNGNKIYDGNTLFVQNGWKAKEFSVPAGYFRKGRNMLKIVNTCQSSDFIDHWALISEIEIKWDN